MSRAPIVFLVALATSAGLVGCGKKESPPPPSALPSSGHQQALAPGDAVIPIVPAPMPAEPSTPSLIVDAENASIELGTLWYPGARFESSQAEVPESSQLQAVLLTPDAFRTVCDYYHQQLPNATVVTDVDTPEISVFELKRSTAGEKQTVLISRSSGDQQTRIMVAKMAPSA